MISLDVRKYDFDFDGTIVGVNNFTRIAPKKSFQKDLDQDGFSCCVDRSIVEDKFRVWRIIQDLGIIGNKGVDKSLIEQVRNAINDKTIFSYAYFKFNANPLKMRYYQDIVLSDKHRRVLFIGSNQIGKSVSLDVDAATEFLIDHKKEWVGLLISNSLTQSKERMKKIRHLLDTSPFNYKTEETDDNKTGKQVSMTTLTYTFYDHEKKPLYTNKLICCPHTSAALGYPANNIWLDEVEFWTNVEGGTMHWIKQVAIPRTFDTKGQIKAYSNPLEGGVMESLMKERDDNGKLVWHTYRFNYWDRADACQEDFDLNSVGMNNAEVCSTLLGDFARSEGSFFSKDEIKDQYSEELQQLGDNAGIGKETYWFLDVGETHDQSCLIGAYAMKNPNGQAQEHGLPLIHAFWIHKYPVGYPISRIIGAESEFTDNDGWEDYVEENPSIKDVLNDYTEVVGDEEFPPLFGFDATNNSAIVPLCQSVGIDPIPIKFNGPNKWAMYQRYQMYTQQRWFKRCKDRDKNAVMTKDGRLSDFGYQAGKLRLKKRSQTGTRYGQIHHENENDLDDTQDCAASVIYLIECPDYSSGDFDIINSEGISVVNNETGELKSDDEIKELKDQYIPSFVDKTELNNWMEDRKLK